MVGKIPPKLLEELVLSRIGTIDPSVIVRPSVGGDASVVDLGDGKVLVAHSDPITGAVGYIGRLAVHVASNDVAVAGVRPRWLLSVIYLPEGSGLYLLDEITSQIGAAAEELGAMVIGGHTEFTPGLDRPLLSMTSMGLGSRESLVKMDSARPGDVLLMTKSVALEGTAIMATDFRDELLARGATDDVLRRAADFVRDVSVVREALALAGIRAASSMHDPTEGGLLGGLAEMAYASSVTVDVDEGMLPIAPETAELCSLLGVDPLRLISSGVLLAAVRGGRLAEAMDVLRAVGAQAAVIGKVVERSGPLVVVHRRDGSAEALGDVYVEDELVRLWRDLRPRS